MVEKDSIEITGKDSKIEVSNVEEIKVKGDDNVIKIEGKDRDIEIKGDDNIITIREESEIKTEFKKSFSFFKQKRVINIIIILLFLIILITSVWVRTQNLPLLKDSTSGKTIPLALDPYYFLRMAETIITDGGLPEYDSMRYPALKVGFTNEILPQVLVLLYRVMNTFGDYSIGFIDVISPVLFFALGLVVFFFLIYTLTKSKIGSLIGCAFLAFIPSYLYRTMAGFADHESIGMFSMLLVFLVFALALKFLEEKDKSWIKMIAFALLVAFLTTFSLTSWGGGAVFIFLIIPLSFLIFWLINYKKIEEKDFALRGLIFYGIWIVFSVLFGLLFSYSMISIFKRFILSSNGIISLWVLGFIIVDYIISLNINKFHFIKKEFRQLYSLIIALVLGAIGLIIIGRNPFVLIFEIWDKLLHPFGLGRTGLTVAENAQPYLTNWISQTGKVLFWFFYLGSLFIGYEISKGIKRNLSRIYFVLLWVLMISGILFSRISPSSLFDGVNLISQFFYLIGLLLFIVYLMKIYFTQGIEIKSPLIIMGVWMFAIIISGRAAIRMFFAITPFICFASGFFVVKMYDYYKKSKEEISRMFLGIAGIIIIVLTVISLFGFVQSVSTTSKYTGPSANAHWQNTMSWVKENTPENALFVHWWDYGYWVQYLGERPTVTDGGHVIGYWDHLIGRYLLTTPYPETALSFMKAQNVSYLLIDPTDVGKYPAYSSIGSDDSHDRYSGIIAMIADPKQIQETSEGEIRVYQGTYGVDEDTIYEVNDSEIFLPGPTYDVMNRPIFKSFIIGIILQTNKEDGKIEFKQPEGVFVYNNKQYRVPLRYLYFNEKIYDFKSGLNSGIKIISMVNQNNAGVQIDNIGALIYLSPRTFSSLIGQLYLLNDSFENYKGVDLAHAEDSPIVKNLKSFNKNIGEFVYFRGIQGPIKIWKINHREDIIAREEFLRSAGDWAEFDNLTFIK